MPERKIATVEPCAGEPLAHDCDGYAHVCPCGKNGPEDAHQGDQDEENAPVVESVTMQSVEEKPMLGEKLWQR